MATCPRPILIHSFDPGGLITLKDEIDEGWIIADSRFEEDDPWNPTSFKRFQTEYNRLGDIGMFNEIGTYCLDPLTTLSMSAVWQIMKKEGRTPAKMDAMTTSRQGMRIQDWGTMLNAMVMITRSLNALPCHTIMTCHYAREQDPVIGGEVVTVMLPGKSAEQVPILSQEMYVLDVKQDSKGEREHRLLTQNDGRFRASTRIGRKEIFDKYEKPDIRYLLKKAGLPYEDISI